MKKIYFKILVIILIIIGSFSVSFANEDEDADYNETKKSIDSYIDNQLEKIDLKEIQIKINKIKEIQYVNEVQSQIAVSIYDEKEAESIYNETVYNLKSLNVKLNKKIPLFLK